MFTGIVEATGKILSVKKEGTNHRYTVESPLSPDLKIDQSLSHDGVCLTVVKVNESTHEVIAVEETLQRSTFGRKKAGAVLNLERSLLLNARLDGHLVQGHVDSMVTVSRIEEKNGSWRFTFQVEKKYAPLLIDKGSVCLNGVSLTVVKPGRRKFSVAVIPFTFEQTNFRLLREGDQVNAEFDVIGKYIQRLLHPLQ
jgi:riboflavin synthase